MDEKFKIFRDKILGEARKGNICYFPTPDECVVTNLKEFIKQPIDGILWDINRTPETILTFIDDPKWVNDYAVYLTIKALKEKIDKLEALKSIHRRPSSAEKAGD